jgi:anti-sigma factor RsiW
VYPVAVLTPVWDCPEFRDRHLDYTDGSLVATDKAAAQAHLERCPDCARFDVRVRRALLVIRNLAPAPGSADLFARIMARVGRSPAAHRHEPAPRYERPRLAAGMPAS